MKTSDKVTCGLVLSKGKCNGSLIIKYVFNFLRRLVRLQCFSFIVGPYLPGDFIGLFEYVKQFRNVTFTIKRCKPFIVMSLSFFKEQILEGTDFVRAIYKKGTGNDKQIKDAGNRAFCPYRNFSQAII